MEDGRLELDDAGRVVGTDVAVVDLADPDATVAVPPTRAHAVAEGTVLPWLRGHRVLAAGLALAAAGVAVGGIWWATRPPYVEPPVPLAVQPAMVEGFGLGAANVSDDGVLSAAYDLRSTSPDSRFDVLGLTGPGISTSDVGPADPVTADAEVRLSVQARIECSDGAFLAATSRDYGLRVRRTDAGSDPVEVTVPLRLDTSPYVAVRDHCVSAYAVPAVSVVESSIVPQAESNLASLALVVRNVSNVPVTVTTERRSVDGVEVDLSPEVTIAPQRAEVVSSRLLVHDCGSPTRPASLASLPDPQIGPGSADPAEVAGIVLRVSSGGASALAAYPLSQTVVELGDALGGTACRARPDVRATVVAATGQRLAGGGWVVSGTYQVRTSGIGITLGREHFGGPAWGAGSVLETSAGDGPWALAPSQLDGGAGSLALRYTGRTCDGAAQSVPSTVPVQVMTADRTVHPFEVPVDTAVLRTALEKACPIA